MSLTYVWLWIGTIGMLIGSFLIYGALASNRNEEIEADLVTHFFVPLIAFALYFLMALHYGSLTTANGRVFYFGRYIDWTFTTPLLLWSLVSSGMQGTGLRKYGKIFGLLAADVYMIATGFVAALTDNLTIKWCFYITSCIAFLFIFKLLFGDFKRYAATGPNAADYNKKVVVLSGLWLAYPIVFIIGQEGLRLWGSSVDSILFTCLDLTAKVIYGLWAVGLAKKSIDGLRTTRTAAVPVAR